MFKTCHNKWYNLHGYSMALIYIDMMALSQHFEKFNSHIANILIFTPEWSAGYSLGFFFTNNWMCCELPVNACFEKIFESKCTTRNIV